MKLNFAPKVFGSPLRTSVLVTTAMLRETYPLQLSRLLGAPLFSVQRIVDGLERERLIATRRRGKERIVSLNPESIVANELRALLIKLADTYPEFTQLRASVRARPRRSGKPLEPSNPEAARRARRLATSAK